MKVLAVGTRREERVALDEHMALGLGAHMIFGELVSAGEKRVLGAV